MIDGLSVGVKGRVPSRYTYLRAGRWTARWPTRVSNDLRPTEDEQTSHSQSTNQSAGEALVEIATVGQLHMLPILISYT